MLLCFVFLLGFCSLGAPSQGTYQEVAGLSLIRVQEKAFYTSSNHLIEHLIKSNATNKVRKRNRIILFLVKNEVHLGVHSDETRLIHFSVNDFIIADGGHLSGTASHS